MGRFDHIEFDDEVRAKSRAIIEAAEALDEAIQQATGMCRAQSVAYTKLDECVMWANRAIAQTAKANGDKWKVRE